MEAAGLALAFLPLLVSALSHRSKCLVALKRFRNPLDDAERFLIMFDVQANIFQSHCRQLLKLFLFKDQRQRLDKGLGDNHQTYQKIVGLIDQQLRNVHQDVQKLESTIVEEEVVSYSGHAS